MTLKEMEALKGIDVRKVDRDVLVDIRDVEVDQSLPIEERIREFVDQVKNPYCFKVGDVVVKVRFNKDGFSFEEQFEKMLAGIR